MDALHLLLNRQSHSKLVSPAPTQTDLELILKAGCRVPDHGHLKPWHFVIIQGEGLDKLSELFVEASPNVDEVKLRQIQSLPYRAPMIIAVIAKIQSHPKVPAWEQVVTAGCTIHAMQMAAFALNYGGIWRSGDWCDNSLIKNALGCHGDDKLVGFLYLGTPDGTMNKTSESDLSSFITYF